MSSGGSDVRGMRQATAVRESESATTGRRQGLVRVPQPPADSGSMAGPAGPHIAMAKGVEAVGRAGQLARAARIAHQRVGLVDLARPQLPGACGLAATVTVAGNLTGLLQHAYRSLADGGWGRSETGDMAAATGCGLIGAALRHWRKRVLPGQAGWRAYGRPPGLGCCCAVHSHRPRPGVRLLAPACDERGPPEASSALNQRELPCT